MKIHIIGTAGSGKTTLALWASRTFAIPAYDLDPIVWGLGAERPEADVVERLDSIRTEDGWIKEGAYHSHWLQPVLNDADGIVWLDVSLSVCMLRIVKRHVLAEMRGNNAHPAWRRLVRFLRYTQRIGRQQRLETSALLAPYGSKVLRGASKKELTRLRSELKRIAAQGV